MLSMSSSESSTTQVSSSSTASEINWGGLSGLEGRRTQLQHLSETKQLYVHWMKLNVFSSTLSFSTMYYTLFHRSRQTNSHTHMHTQTHLECSDVHKVHSSQWYCSPLVAPEGVKMTQQHVFTYTQHHVHNTIHTYTQHHTQIHTTPNTDTHNTIHTYTHIHTTPCTHTH